MNKSERVVVAGGLPKDALVMSVTEYMEWEQSRAGITEPQLNRAQRRALEKERKRGKQPFRLSSI